MAERSGNRHRPDRPIGDGWSIDQLFYAVAAEPTDDELERADELSCARVAADVQTWMNATRPQLHGQPPRRGPVAVTLAPPVRSGRPGPSRFMPGAKSLCAVATLLLCAGGTALLLSDAGEFGGGRAEPDRFSSIAREPSLLAFAAVAQTWSGSAGESWYVRITRRTGGSGAGRN